MPLVEVSWPRDFRGPATAVCCCVGCVSHLYPDTNYASSIHRGRHFNPLPRQAQTSPLSKKSRNSGSGSCCIYIRFPVRSPVLSTVMPAVVASPATMVASPCAVTIPAWAPRVPVIPRAVAVIIPWCWGHNHRRRHRDRRGRYRHRWWCYYDRRRDDSHTRQRYPYPDAHADASLRGHERPE